MMTRLDELLSGEKLFIGAHRGFSSNYPENTLLSIWEGVRLGVDLVEVDVSLTSDEIPVLAHDFRLERCSNAKGHIHEFSLSELKRLDFGGHKHSMFSGLKLPTLEEFVEMMLPAAHVLINIDFKVYPHTMKTVQKVMPILQSAGLIDRCIFNCVDCDVVEYLCDHYGKRTVGAPYFYPGILNFKTGGNGTISKLWGVCFPQKDLTPEHAEYYRSRGVSVVCTSPDTPEQVKQSLSCNAVLPLCNDPRNFIKAASDAGIWKPYA